MNQDNRVLSRRGARELTPRESEYVTGSLIVHTNTACTFGLKPGGVAAPDGDTNECGGL